jgi:hypothetical protein
LSRGIAVYGAASLGALRALELRSYGMIGVGQIFEAFADGTLLRDDEVALIHGPGEASYAPLSEPLVNIRWTLAAAVEAGIIDPGTRDGMVARAAATFYPRRSYAALLEGEIVAARLGEWLPGGRIDQKRADALACLERVANDRSGNSLAAAPRFHFNHSDAFEALIMDISDNPVAEADEEDTAALQRLRSISPEAAAALEVEAERDTLALLADARSDDPPTPADLARQVAAFRGAAGLHDRASLASWLATRGLDIDALSKGLHEDARIARVRNEIAPVVAKRVAAALRRRLPKRPSRA